MTNKGFNPDHLPTDIPTEPGELNRMSISQRCRIHAGKMDGEGWYVTSNVLWAAADEIDGLKQELAHYKSLEANQS